jgi:hypothetical protein
MPGLAREIRKRCQNLRRNLTTSKSARLGVRTKHGFKPLDFVQNQIGDDIAQSSVETEPTAPLAI